MIGLPPVFADTAAGTPAAGTPAAPAPDWTWLVPSAGPTPGDKPDDPAALHLPGSTRHFTHAQVRDLKHAVDWYPEEHPAMPAAVREGRGAADACGFCHLPTGNGRPENSALAGLPAEYMKRQVAAFADGSRRSAAPNHLPMELMTATAKAASPEGVSQAAAYFGRLRYVSYVEVVEAETAEFTPGNYIYVRQPGAAQPIGDRIIEVPADLERFERRDPHVRFTAYVRPGSVEAGRRLVASGGPAGQPCAACHGVGLRGGIAPPLAGRSPTMLMRQLASFHEGSRRNPEAAPMRAVTAPLDTRAMIALAAYAATLTP